MTATLTRCKLSFFHLSSLSLLFSLSPLHLLRSYEQTNNPKRMTFYMLFPKDYAVKCYAILQVKVKQITRNVKTCVCKYLHLDAVLEQKNENCINLRLGSNRSSVLRALFLHVCFNPLFLALFLLSLKLGWRRLDELYLCSGKFRFTQTFWKNTSFNLPWQHVIIFMDV